MAVIALQAGTPGVAQIAHEQLTQIRTIKENWNTWTRTFGTEQTTWLTDNKQAWPGTVAGRLYIPPNELRQKNLPQSDLG